MKQLNRIENIILLLGAAMMLTGSVASIFLCSWAPYLFAMGAIAFVLMQLRQKYEGRNLVIQRLRRIMIFSDLLFLSSALLMYAGYGNPFKFDMLTYVKYIHNNWVVTLLVAAVLQLYVVHRISKELNKEAKKI
ncbi:MAG: hypothetical protein J6B91_03570 [Prevotella sp.]|nr:hypothetical protein [Prevotella sp.]